MKLEDQVISLELAKKLNELGVKQESLFYFYECNNTHKLRYRDWKTEISGEVSYSAFTVSELGEILPENIEIKIISSDGKKLKNIEKYYLVYFKYRNEIRYFGIDNNNISLKKNLLPEFYLLDESEANSRAKMLIYLLENGLMELPK